MLISNMYFASTCLRKRQVKYTDFLLGKNRIPKGFIAIGMRLLPSGQVTKIVVNDIRNDVVFQK